MNLVGGAHLQGQVGAPGVVGLNRLGDRTAGLFPGADILRNERTTGDILNVPIEVPALAKPSANPR